MREFEKPEIIRAKCIVCGCKNKLHTEILNRNNEFIGYSLKCCACGNKHDFMLDYKDNGKTDPDKISLNYHKGKQHCIQPSYCPRKDCLLYGTYDEDDKKKNDSNKGTCSCGIKNCTCKGDCNRDITVEVIQTPNFL